MSKPKEAALSAKLPSPKPADGDGQADGVGDAGSEKTKKRGKKDETRSFKVISALRHNGETFEVGSEVELPRDAFLALKGGAVEGDWPEDD